MKVKFLPQNIEVEIKPNESVLSVAQDHGIHIQSVCKGIPSCAECRVHIVEGETNVVPPLQPELELIGTAYYIDRRRLSCQLRCFGDVVVDLSEQIEKQSKSTKNPQGRFVKERDDSHARMGNILEEERAAQLEEALQSDPDEVAEAEKNKPNIVAKQNSKENFRGKNHNKSGGVEGRSRQGGRNKKKRSNNSSSSQASSADKKNDNRSGKNKKRFNKNRNNQNQNNKASSNKGGHHKPSS